MSLLLLFETKSLFLTASFLALLGSTRSAELEKLFFFEQEQLGQLSGHLPVQTA